MQKLRKLTIATIKKIYNESVQGTGILDGNAWTLNVKGFKLYAFTPDYYQGKPSWSGSYWGDIRDCYSSFDGIPFEKYAVSIDGIVYDLTQKISLPEYTIKTN